MKSLDSVTYMLKTAQMKVKKVQKRSGEIVAFEEAKIVNAINKAIVAVEGKENIKLSEKTAETVTAMLNEKFGNKIIPSVEDIQDLVEESLIKKGLTKVAKAYILYRSKRAEVRESRKFIPENVKDLADESKKYFRNDLAEFIYYRTYSRWIDEQGRRETWIETVARYIDFMRENLGNKLEDKEYEELGSAILNQEVVPSMRLMWGSGKAARKNNVTAYNCSYIAPSKLQDFSEIMYLSMCGTGVGFSVESQTVQRLPIIKHQTGKVLPTHVIEDSKEGWGNALTVGLKAWYGGKDINFDYSKVRPAGSRLRTMGGQSSGPEPLRALLDFSRKKILSKQGKRLSNLNVHDIICKIGEVVVMGGVRRSALLSLSDFDDEEMRHAKDGQFYLFEPQRQMSNNSVAYNKKPTTAEFMEEWVALAKSGTGERGIFNRAGLKKQLPERRWKVFKKYWQTSGTNPCGEIVLRSKQFCVSGDTYLITRDGIETIKGAVGKEVEIWNGKKWSKVTPIKTGENQKMLRVSFRDGSYLDCTPDHRFSVKHRFQNEWREVQAKDLLAYSRYTLQIEPTRIIYDDGVDYPEAYDLGVIVGDGHIYNGVAFVDLYGKKDFDLPIIGTRHKEYLPKGYNLTKVRVRTGLNAILAKNLKTNAEIYQALFSWNRPSILNFVAGLIDADGSETDTGGVRLYISVYERARMIQLLLAKCGIASSVNLMQRKGSVTNLGIRKSDIYYLQITDCAEMPCKRVNTSRGHTPRFRGKYQNIKGVIELPGVHDSFCFEEQEEHKAVFNNVLTYQCNLSEVICRFDDTKETLIRKICLATILGTYQSTLTNFPYLSKAWKENCEEERLLGVSLTGQWDCPTVRDSKVLNALREESLNTNKKYAKKFGINVSTCITCVKPSGTVSQLVDAASGMHPRHAKYYIRRVRISANDPLFHMLRDQKFPYYPEVGQLKHSASTYVLEFPVKAPKGAITRDNISSIDQLEHWKLVKENYTEHNPSVTVSVGDDEWIQASNWLYGNWDMLGGLSFLPRTDHSYALAPYEEISKEKYNELYAKMPKIDFSQILLYEKEDTTQGAKELACVAGVCEIEEVTAASTDATGQAKIAESA